MSKLFKNENKFVDITIVLDKSGSMYHLWQDTIGSLNSFIEEQKQEEGKVNLTLVLFDQEVKVAYSKTEISTLETIDAAKYSPLGGTALYDAIGSSIEKAKERIKNYEHEADEVIFVVLTDGEENSSTEYNSSSINKMISDLTEKEKWNFVFLGSNQDAWQASKTMGFAAGSTMSFSSNVDSTKDVFKSVSKAVVRSRKSSGKGLEGMGGMFFSQSDYKEQATHGAINSQIK